MTKNQTKTAQPSPSIKIEPKGAEKPRRLGRGLSALLGEPVAITIPGPAESQPSATRPAPAEAPRMGPATSASGHKGGGGSMVVAQDADGPDAGPRVMLIETAKIEPGKYQPRRTFDEAQLKELAESIKVAGVVQPILVRPRSGAPHEYELVAGERRWRASRIAGLARVPAVVTELTDQQAAEWGLIENLQRADLSPMERAWAVRTLCQKFGLTQAEVAERLGIERSSAANLLRLTELETPIHELLDAGQLSLGHGKVLLSAAPGETRIGLAKSAASQGWSVKRLEQAVARFGQGSTQIPAHGVKASEAALAKAAAVKDLERQLSDHLGTSVKIRANAGGKRGSVVIKFYDLDHFDGLMHKMGFAPK